MASNNNQGTMVAMIIFVIIAVLSMGVAAIFVKEAGVLAEKQKAAKTIADQNVEAYEKVENELNDLKDLVFVLPERANEEDRPTIEQIKEQRKSDLKKFGARLNTITTAAEKPTYPDEAINQMTYTQMLEAAVALAEARNIEIEKERAKVVLATKEKLDEQVKAKNDIDQFKNQVAMVEKEKADVQQKLAKAEEDVKNVKLENTTIIAKLPEEIQKVQTTMNAIVAEKDARIAKLESDLKIKNDQVLKLRIPEFATSYDGKVTKINPTARTVWINVGKYDNLPTNLTFSVQPEGVPPGSNLKPKAKIEVIELLGEHLAEARILEDDMRNPILPGDNIYTQAWEPGQLTRFGFAGKIDLDANGSDDMDQVRALVQRAGGQIDVEIRNGELLGKLDVETRYLVLGTVPADKAGAALYAKLIADAETLGIQRVPMGIFFDQIGYKRPGGTTVYGRGSNNVRTLDQPDGGAPVSDGVVTDAFKIRRPPAAAGNKTSAY